MTKEYESRKNDGKTKPLMKIFEVVVRVLLCFVAFLFLLMVIFPKGGWVDLFR